MKQHAHNWKGGRVNFCGRYIGIWFPEHPRANGNGYVAEHILIAEKALGHPLPLEAPVHHVDTNPEHNENNNLVICEDGSYHIFLHRREQSLKACGHASWRQCYFCHEYDTPENLKKARGHRSSYHPSCEAANHKRLRELRKLDENSRMSVQTL
jgi:hypothetical protein